MPQMKAAVEVRRRGQDQLDADEAACSQGGRIIFETLLMKLQLRPSRFSDHSYGIDMVQLYDLRRRSVLCGLWACGKPAIRSQNRESVRGPSCANAVLLRRNSQIP